VPYVEPEYLLVSGREFWVFCSGGTEVLLSIWRALAKSKRGVSKFHTRVLRLIGIKVHDDALPNTMMWREVETAAAEREYPAGLRVWPLCCHNPPTAHRASFYLNLGDGGFDSPVEAPSYLTLEGDDEAGDQYESGNRYEDEHGLGIHRLF
jgi:hypothetical protein